MRHWSRLRGAIHAFERRSLRLIGVVGLLLLLLGIVVGPTSTVGAIAVSIATSFIASVIVAAFALEREAFAQALMDMGVHHVFRDRKKDFEDEFWSDLIKGATTHFKVLGTANHGYWHDAQTREDTEKTLREAIVKRKVDVEFLFLKPDGPLCDYRGQEEQRNTPNDALDSIDRFWAFRESLPAEHRDRLCLREYELTPSCGITWVDDTLVVTHYLAGRNNLGSPGLLLRSGHPVMDTLFRPVGGDHTPGPLTDVYIRNYKEIASDERSTKIDEDRIEEIRALRAARADEPSVSEADLRKEEDADGL